MYWDAMKENITDRKLRISFDIIRDAVTTIWDSTAPRIIHGFTDHGWSHCENIAKNASELLKNNKGRPLTDKEQYLLLAGIAFHDIGMQCHLSINSDIFNRAIRLGASFPIAFTTTDPYLYTDEEQKAIRENHQYLSAAWIDHSFNLDDKILRAEAQAKDRLHIKEVIDVCMYKAAQSIDRLLIKMLWMSACIMPGCQFQNALRTFTIYQNERKQYMPH